MTAPDQDREIDRALEEVRPAAVPDDLLPEVMARVSAMEGGWSSWRRWRRRTRGQRLTNFLGRAGVSRDTHHAFAVEGGAIVRNKILAGVVGLAAVAAVSFFVFGYPPIGDDGTEATIGAAQRYQGARLTAADVKVPDSDVQQFIQSETFDRLLKDSTMRTALQQLLSNAELAEAMSKPSFLQVLGGGDWAGFIALLKRPKVIEAFNNEGALEALKRRKMIETMSRADVADVLHNPALILALNNPDVVRALHNPDVVEALSRPNTLEALKKAKSAIGEAAWGVLTQPNVIAVLHQPAALELLNEPAFRQMLSHPGALQVLSSAEVLDALAQPAFMQVLSQPAIAELLSRPALTQAFMQPAMVQAFSQPAFAEALNQPAMIKVLSQDTLRAAIMPMFQER